MEELEGLKLLISESTGQNIFMFSHRKTVIEFRGEDRCELYLRSERVPIPTLVIARIEMVPRHQGIGTQVLEWLKRYAVTKGFKRIVVENANTDDSVQFAKKRGFVKCYNPIDQLLGTTDEEMFCNYELMLV